MIIIIIIIVIIIIIIIIIVIIIIIIIIVIIIIIIIIIIIPFREERCLGAKPIIPTWCNPLKLINTQSEVNIECIEKKKEYLYFICNFYY